MSDVLLVIDVQQSLLDELGAPRAAELLATLVPIVDGARAKGLPIVYVRHDGSPHELIPGTPEWQIVNAIAPRAGDPIIEKRSADAFEQTTLIDVLASLGADHLIVAGMQTDMCVSHTIAGATERGYRVSLVGDAHATSTPNEPAIRAAMHETVLGRGAFIVRSTELFG
jgi:nicotinamidase-related amidase